MSQYIRILGWVVLVVHASQWSIPCLNANPYPADTTLARFGSLEKHETVDTLLKLVRQYRDSDPEKAYLYAETLIHFSDSLDHHFWLVCRDVVPAVFRHQETAAA